MKLSEHKDLKKEILALPTKEKDKLLLRLVAKDQVLTEHYHFLLLEDEADLQQRVKDIKAEILATTENLATMPKLNAKETLTSLRHLAKLVNHFYKVTKSTPLEVELKLLMLAKAPVKFRFNISSRFGNYEDRYATYFVKSAQTAVTKFYKLHEDFQFDLSADLRSVLEKTHATFSNKAKDLGLPSSL